MTSITAILIQSNHYINYCSAREGKAMLIVGTGVLHFGQNKRAASSKLYHLKARAEYYPYIHSAPFNPASADFGSSGKNGRKGV